MALITGNDDDDDDVILVCTNTNTTKTTKDDDDDDNQQLLLISTKDINNWNLSTILHHHVINIQANRNTESCLDYISIDWELTTFLIILKAIHGCSFCITSNNFISLIQGALYFGVESLLLKCKRLLSEVSSPNVQLDELIHIWNFGVEHLIDFLPQLCVSYLARNFMWASSSKFFEDVPYNFLSSCLSHSHLTIESEKHRSDALLLWLNARTEHMKDPSLTEADITDLLKLIPISCLPLWLATGKAVSFYFSKLVRQTVSSTLNSMKILPSSFINELEDGDLNLLRIRFTEFSKKVDLSGCPQITSAVLLLSVPPSLSSMNLLLRKSIKQCLTDLESTSGGRNQILSSFPEIISFQTVDELDISKCSRLHLETAIECFSESFPCLRILKASYLLDFNTTTLWKLIQKCPKICEVDLTVDPSPIIPSQVTILSSSLVMAPAVSENVSVVSNNSLETIMSYKSGQSLSKITKLSLEGRSDIHDFLEHITKFLISLRFINLKGCISLTDVCISNLLRSCIKLQSVIVCDTSFGMNSILALCSSIPNFNSNSVEFGKKEKNSLASALQTLHIGGCKNVDESSLAELMSHMQELKSLCLRDTCLVDNTLYNFQGSSLEMLDISNTMVSADALAHVFRRNLCLKSLNARGCKHLIHVENNSMGFSSPYSSEAIFTELGKRCKLETIELSWGFSDLSFVALKPAIESLRSITVGLGGSLGEYSLGMLPTVCPLLESIILYFQAEWLTKFRPFVVISDSVIMDIMASLRNLQVLALCYCFGDVSISSFKFSFPNLRVLKLERVTPSMTNDDLIILTKTCMNLVELSLLGCLLLNSVSQDIISHGWPGLTSIQLEDCGDVTAKGISSLLNCTAVEDILLRHNGSGLPKNIILEAASKIPMLRKLSLDMCDAIEGDFDIPEYADRCSLSHVNIARCKGRKTCSRKLHEATLVLVWNNKSLTRTVVKERL
ncbi:hypothetical protein ACFE04_020256 [Oxalis oulophora]